MRIIALYSSSPQQGKSTAALTLANMYAGVERLSFAQPVRNMLNSMLSDLGVSDISIHHYSTQDKNAGIPELDGITYRHLARTIGTEWGRNLVSPNLWITIMENQIFRAQKEKKQLVIIDDLRFMNEYSMIGGLAVYFKDVEMWRIIRPGVTNDDVGHASDGMLDDQVFDLTLYNDSTIGCFKIMINQCYAARTEEELGVRYASEAMEVICDV